MLTPTTPSCKLDADIRIASLKQALNNLKRKLTSATHIRKLVIDIHSAWIENHNQEKYEVDVDIRFEHF